MNRRNKNGITLIALVITIVILLILAGIAIFALLGENGIINKSTIAKEETQKGEATDIINLKITNIQINSFAKTQKMPTLQYLADSFCEDNEIEYVELESKKLASLEKINVGENKSIFTKLKQYPYEFEINNSLQLASINGVKVASTQENKTIEEIQSKIQELESTNENLKTTIETMQSKVATLEEENNKLNNIQEMTSKMKTTIETLQSKVATLETENNKLNSIQDITSKMILNYVKGTKYNVKRNGKTVQIEINGDTGSNPIPANQVCVIATGLPKCASGTGIQELAITLDDPSIYARSWIDGNGKLYIFQSKQNYSNNVFIGGTYLTNE